MRELWKICSTIRQTIFMSHFFLTSCRASGLSLPTEGVPVDFGMELMSPTAQSGKMDPQSKHSVAILNILGTKISEKLL